MALWLYDHFWGYLELPSNQRKPLNNTTEGALRLELATEKKKYGEEYKTRQNRR